MYVAKTYGVWPEKTTMKTIKARLLERLTFPVPQSWSGFTGGQLRAMTKHTMRLAVRSKAAGVVRCSFEGVVEALSEEPEG